MEKSVEEKIVDGELVTGNYTIQGAMPMGKSITMSGYIYASNTVEGINKQIDTMHDVMDRQRLRAEIPELEAKMDQRMAGMRNMKDALEALQAKKVGGAKLSSAEKKMVDDMITSIRVVSQDIDKGLIAIEDAKKKAGK